MARDFDTRFKAMDKPGLDDVSKLLFSTHCPVIGIFRPVLMGGDEARKELIPARMRSEAAQVVGVLRNCSDYAEVDNRSILMFEFWIQELYKLVFSDKLGDQYDDFVETLQPAKHGKIVYLLALVCRPDLKLVPVDISYLRDFIDDGNTPEKEDLDTLVVRAMQNAIARCKRTFNISTATPRWGEIDKEKYGPIEYERFGGMRTLRCLGEKESYFLSGANTPPSGGGAGNQRQKYRPLYKIAAELSPEEGIQAYTIVARNQGHQEPGAPHYFDQGKLYRQKKLKKFLYNYKDVIAGMERSRVIPTR